LEPHPETLLHYLHGASTAVASVNIDRRAKWRAWNCWVLWQTDGQTVCALHSAGHCHTLYTRAHITVLLMK